MKLGIMFRGEWEGEKLLEFAPRAERAGFDELWLIEDAFLNGGISTSAAALALTDNIKVGLGLMPAVVRNPLYAAMEIASIARMFPGRFLPAFGHGVAGWLKQVGSFPSSQMAALEEITVSVKRLLNGERFDFAGQHVNMQDVYLLHPPEDAPPIYLGVTGEKSLALSGRIADGTIIPEFCNPTYLKWAKECIATGQQDAERSSEHHHITLYIHCSVGEDRDAARQVVRQRLAELFYSGWIDMQLNKAGILPEVKLLRDTHDQQGVARAMPDPWVDDFAVAGSVEDFRKGLQRFQQAGVDSLVLVPLPNQDPALILEMVATVK